MYFVAKIFEISWVTLRMVLEAVDFPMPNAFATFLNLPSYDKKYKVEGSYFSKDIGLRNRVVCF